MNTLKSIVVALALGYQTLACGPDGVTNNYYGGKGNSSNGNSGNYTCDDFGEAERACLSKEEPQDHGFAVESAGFCRDMGFTQDCIDCVVKAPCTISSDGTSTGHHLNDPTEYCINKGICPP